MHLLFLQRVQSDNHIQASKELGSLAHGNPISVEHLEKHAEAFSLGSSCAPAFPVDSCQLERFGTCSPSCPNRVMSLQLHSEAKRKAHVQGRPERTCQPYQDFWRSRATGATNRGTYWSSMILQLHAVAIHLGIVSYCFMLSRVISCCLVSPCLPISAISHPYPISISWDEPLDDALVQKLLVAVRRWDPCSETSWNQENTRNASLEAAVARWPNWSETDSDKLPRASTCIYVHFACDQASSPRLPTASATTCIAPFCTRLSVAAGPTKMQYAVLKISRSGCKIRSQLIQCLHCLALKTSWIPSSDIAQPRFYLLIKNQQLQQLQQLINHAIPHNDRSLLSLLYLAFMSICTARCSVAGRIFLGASGMTWIPWDDLRSWQLIAAHSTSSPNEKTWVIDPDSWIPASPPYSSYSYII